MTRNQFIFQATLSSLRSGKDGSTAACYAKIAADTIQREGYAKFEHEDFYQKLADSLGCTRSEAKETYLHSINND